MPRRPDPSLKPAIVRKVVEHLRTTKLEDVSVRSLGRVLGTSAYPIVYHFGTREALIDAVVEHLASGADLDPDADRTAVGDYLVAVFGRLDDPDRLLSARLAFELGAVERLDHRDRQRGAHRDQVARIAAWCRAHGRCEPDAERVAQDVVLAARGIQWGRILDPERVDADRALRALVDELVDDVPALASR